MSWLFQEQIMTGTDLSLLAEEMRKAQEVLEKIKEMKSGIIGSTKIAVQASVESTVSTVSTVRNLRETGGKTAGD